MAKETFSVERSALIQAPAAAIYEQLADFRNWRAWSPWEDADPNLNRTYSGAESGTGAAYAWSGNRQAGQGRMLITEATSPSVVQLDLIFEKPFKAQNLTLFTITPEGEGQRVTWTMSGPVTLMGRVLGLFTSMDKILGPNFERGLEQLKAVAEKQA